MKEMNKRGAELTIGTIIIIILAVIVLVFLIYGFTVGWGNLFDKIGNFGGGQSNLDTVVQACEIACTTQSQHDYCTLKRDVVLGKKDKAGDGKYNCKAVEILDSSLKCDIYKDDKVCQPIIPESSVY